MRAIGHGEEAIKHYLTNCGAIASAGARESTVYFKFEKLNAGRGEQTILKTDIKHELTHALTSRLQNTNITDIYKSGEYKCNKQTLVFNKIFALFEGNYYLDGNLSETKITKKSMLNELDLIQQKLYTIISKKRSTK